ncbi:HNH endonuclease family protein [Kutzneria buriramensis]|uniref:GmrSD restriction endonucleases C-terminal domain-containing protein n=1 Tax=Kutzneria buriramensis TaxID=1045776 RepID=A0A3E0GXJ6_9PSEU|nr:HNH endonuclease family protein [Kutzneria buriramensis]REH30994.1 hypothetical protein BCF44_12217 [Kutzneria buriramensis]
MPRAATVVLILAATFAGSYATDLFGFRVLVDAVGSEISQQVRGLHTPAGSGDGIGLSTAEATRVPDGTLDLDQAREALTRLAVAPQGTLQGFADDQFGPWERVGACDTREEVLRRDGTDVRTDQNCAAQSGTWYSPYDALVEKRPADVDVDHVTSLTDAWRSGAASWTPARRAAFANDTRNLLTASTSAIHAKAQRDAATWQPTRMAYQCPFARIVITVKDAYRLTVTAAERAALQRLLDTCPLGPAALASGAGPGSALSPALTPASAVRRDKTTSRTSVTLKLLCNFIVTPVVTREGPS